MNKYDIIGIVAVIVIGATLSYSGVNFAMLGNLQLKQTGNDMFDYSHLAAGLRFELCNPSVLPVTYSGVEINIRHKDSRFATLSEKDGGVIYPYQEKLVEPEFDFGKEKISAMFSSSFLNSNLENLNSNFVDPAVLDVSTTYHGRVLGVIPVSSSNQYTGHEFIEQLNNNTNYNC